MIVKPPRHNLPGRGYASTRPVTIGPMIARVLGGLGLVRSDPLPGVIPPARSDDATIVSPASASRIGAVFSAVTIIATAVEQCSLDIERGDQLADSKQARLIARPDPEMSRSGWLHLVTTALALRGNAYLRVYRTATGAPSVLRFLHPDKVIPYRDKHGNKRFQVSGKDDLTPASHASGDILHLGLLWTGGMTALGPIQAAQDEISTAQGLAKASRTWISRSGMPSGVLRHTQRGLTQEQAEQISQKWDEKPAGRTRVIGADYEYTPVALSARDAQYLETRRYSRTEIYDLFGIPASLALGLDNAGSSTYANVEQDWLGFVRFRLMRYMREIEEGLGQLLPSTQQVRFNLSSLLRSDARSRMEVHKLAIEAGIYTPAYARTLEHLPEEAAR